MTSLSRILQGNVYCSLIFVKWQLLVKCKQLGVSHELFNLSNKLRCILNNYSYSHEYAISRTISLISNNSVDIDIISNYTFTLLKKMLPENILIHLKNSKHDSNEVNKQ